MLNVCANIDWPPPSSGRILATVSLWLRGNLLLPKGKEKLEKFLVSRCLMK